MRTYTSRTRTLHSSDPVVTSESSPESNKRKLISEETDLGSRKRVKTSVKEKKPERNSKSKQRTLVQLHFCVDKSIIRKCAICDLCYTKGAKDDEELHRVHCSRVQRGLEWSREVEKEGYGSTIHELESMVKMEKGKMGRIICFPANVNGKMGGKLKTLLEMVNLSLSSPELDTAALQRSKVYLFLVQEGTHSRPERVVGCAIAQQIKAAMAVLPPAISDSLNEASNSVDVGGTFCNPKLLPTAMGISRLFVSSTYRRQGIARRLLSAAASTFIPGCPLDPHKGEIAFSQPTGNGAQVMHSWGGGNVRVYEDNTG
ncbi:hypothetical protein FA15DRAFT_608577 [Coprinopsis marcescibilis]|uniref:N-acetyltransferase ESCO acetyl-transferase domain-containing protein n=1 Tax=Coprinopsis marcescibilis TaxID=230819 RepID=A0A5C3LAI7_COPMA|nr:hypothetical protein FA15DRAFT_608577 [Coprinopsis marcescibilis]